MQKEVVALLKDVFQSGNNGIDNKNNVLLTPANRHKA
jgi:hypothetical protein